MRHRVLIYPAQGYNPYRISCLLNDAGIPTVRGNRFTPHGVKLILLQYAASPRLQEQVRNSAEFRRQVMAELEAESEKRREAEARMREAMDPTRYLDPENPERIEAREREAERRAQGHPTFTDYVKAGPP